MGEILFGGTSALLICIFLSPKFIAFLREREFGQHIREDGPEGHHLKAGTPTMGGVIVFLAGSVARGLGGAIAALPVMTKTGVLPAPLGRIFVVEALSHGIHVLAFQ